LLCHGRTAAIERGSLLLLDEPETHLHPNLISDMMDTLSGLLDATGSIAIIATHSAYIVREVTRAGVKVMTLEDGVLSVDTPRMQTFGASIDTISQFVFSDTNMLHRHQELLKNWVNELDGKLTIREIISQYGSSLNSESLSYIARSLNERREGEPE
jgi:ABC-type sulfate/molybdate transport systems ATPase subunit